MKTITMPYGEYLEELRAIKIAATLGSKKTYAELNAVFTEFRKFREGGIGPNSFGNALEKFDKILASVEHVEEKELGDGN